LLTSSEALGNNGALDAQQLQYVQHIESTYTKRVMDILEPVLGRDNLRAQVSAEIDFSQQESTSEQFRPNQGNEPAAVRSAQSAESGGPGQAQPTGVPGATTNQPPVPATAPINGASAPLQPAQTGSTGGNSRRESVTNYEVDKTVRVVRGATGSVKRLSAAVVVNHRTVTDKKGNPQTEPLSPEEIDKLTALVQETLGYNKERGDTVKVVNAPFRVQKPEVDETPLWKQPEIQETLRSLAAPLGLALLGAIIVFGVIRPVLKETRPPEVVERVEAVVDDLEKLPGLENGGTAGAQGDGATNPDGTPALPAPELDPATLTTKLQLEAARKMARENPAAVANIMRNWVNKD
jgi:flagellar M-ring protein FliF